MGPNAVIRTYRSAMTLDTLGITQIPSKHWGPKESRGPRQRKTQKQDDAFLTLNYWQWLKNPGI